MLGLLVLAGLAFGLQTPAQSPSAKGVEQARGLAFEGRYEEALAQFRLALAFDPEDPLLNYYVGVTLFKMEKPRPARLYFRRSIDFKADFPEPYLWLGRVEIQLSELDSAQRVVEEGLKKFPRHKVLLQLRHSLRNSVPRMDSPQVNAALRL